DLAIALLVAEEDHAGIAVRLEHDALERLALGEELVEHLLQSLDAALDGDCEVGVEPAGRSREPVHVAVIEKEKIEIVLGHAHPPPLLPGDPEGFVSAVVRVWVAAA